MSNTEKLKEYLIGKDQKKGYLLDNTLSNGKVIMLSGEWGSGKTHFWQNEIKEKIKDKPYAYVSLYGKTSIASIENDLYMQIYSSTNNEGDFISKGCSTLLTTYAKVFKPVSIINAEESEKLVLESKHKKAIDALKENALICFDDFERKSKDVDLNDLFGFITQLALNFNIKIVLILNSDVFEGKEKEVFTNVKEKTVSKYLKFTPTCKELFEIIFNDKKYEFLKKDIQNDEKKIEKTLKDTFCEVGIVNARILIQVLDNILEWKEKKESFCTPFYIRYFVLVNINFILNHYVFEAKLEEISTTEDLVKALDGIYQFYKEEYERINDIKKDVPQIRTISQVKANTDFDFGSIRAYLFKDNKYSDKFINDLKVNVRLGEKEEGIDSKKADYGDIIIDFINENEALFKSLHYMHCFEIYMHGESNNEPEVKILNEINNFIETGVL